MYGIHRMKTKPVSVAEWVNGLGGDDDWRMSLFSYAELLKAAERSTRANGKGYAQYRSLKLVVAKCTATWLVNLPLITALG